MPQLTLEKLLQCPETKPYYEFIDGRIEQQPICLCLSQETQMAWLVNSEDESVMIFKPNEFPEIKSDAEILPVLPGLEDLQLLAAEVFDWLRIN